MKGYPNAQIYAGGRYLTLSEHQIALEDMLVQFARPFGYPLAGHLRRLKEFWERSRGGNPMAIIL